MRMNKGKCVTNYFAVLAALIALVIYLVRGPKYALGALLVAGALYAGFVWFITASM